MLHAGLFASVLFAATAANKPVVAVFVVEDRARVLERDAREQLTEYFALKLAETGGIVMVPRADLEDALVKAKADSYRECYDRKCQIEVGRELAAQKLVHPQIVRLGDRCTVSASVYDLRLAVVERATSLDGACTPYALADMFGKIAATFGGSASQPASRPRAAGFTLEVAVEPSDAAIVVDGKKKGSGQAKVELTPDREHTVVVERSGFVTRTESVRLTRDTQLGVVLELTTEERRRRIEWVGLSASTAFNFSGTGGVGAWVRFAQLPFGDFIWTVAELNFGLYATRDYRIPGCAKFLSGGNARCAEFGTATSQYYGTRAGWRFALEDTYEHSLEVNLGAGYYHLSDSKDGVRNFAISPGVQYLRRGSGRLTYGVGVRAIVPAGRGGCSDTSGSTISSYLRCEERQPIMVQLEVPLGWAF